ncbi:MAG: type III glutamate--ammonia ligase [Bdellovibrionales bacterium]
MALTLQQLCKDKNIKYMLVSFVDLFGVMRSKLVPASAAQATQEGGAAFAGFATHLDLTPAHPDIFVMPDPETFTPMPWQPDVAWVTGDLMMDGEPIAHSPRNLLKKLTLQAKKSGYTLNTGVEPEFFILNKAGQQIADAQDQQAKPCYDQVALMRNYKVIDEICTAMNEMGWKPYQNDHEDGNGQFEMNWHYDDALKTADRHSLFKILARTIAEKNDLRITFMPKPFSHLSGNGCHAHFSLWDAANKNNLFVSKTDSHGLSELAYQFLGGVMTHAKAICALTNPSVNSYQRLNAVGTSSGATWSPNRISYTGNNRTHMVRIPDGGRFELRVGDGSANPYLLQAGLLAAGLDGLARKLNPGERSDENMYTSSTAEKFEKLPNHLIESLNALESDTVLREILGQQFVTSYIKLRTQDWKKHMSMVTDWDRINTLDC